MGEKNYFVLRFDGATGLLPGSLGDKLRDLPYGDKARAEEIHLRCGITPTVVISGIEIPFRTEPVSSKELECTLDIVTGASAHSTGEAMRLGYVTAPGGYRVGICGSAVVKYGAVSAIKSISSLNIRISRQIKGAGDKIVEKIIENDRVQSSLIVSPPGGGKTTLLRDIVRILSDGSNKNGVLPYRVGLADERGEVAAVSQGKAQMDVGTHTDIISLCPKAEAITMLVRSMNPQVIAADEITAEQDVLAIISASYCGSAIIASAHAESAADLRDRPVYKKLMESKVFSKLIFIENFGGERKYRVADVKEEIC